MEKDEFYIGYSTEHPVKTMRFLKFFITILGIVVLGVAIIFALGQKPFKNSTFELGSLTEVEGVLHLTPYPFLRTTLADGASKDILLLGFGKFGATKGLQKIFENKNPQGMAIRLNGTLIYYEGKTLLQLESDVSGTYTLLGKTNTVSTIKEMGNVSLKGEVIDPKCYFGVMKPAFGKIHRSCAIRCISGGIPPVYVTMNAQNEASYYLITDEKGEPIHDAIIDYVGKPSEIQGKLVDLGDWMQIRLNPNTIKLIDQNSAIY